MVCDKVVCVCVSRRAAEEEAAEEAAEEEAAKERGGTESKTTQRTRNRPTKIVKLLTAPQRDANFENTNVLQKNRSF